MNEGMVMKSIIDDLRTLCDAPGCAGQSGIVDQTIALLRPHVDEIELDAMGNILAIRRAEKENAKTVMLEAHLDEIGFLVTHVDEQGFVFVAPAGGVDKRVLTAQKVIVYGNKPFNGVFSSVPPHLSTQEDKLPDITDMAIDVGLDAKTAKEQIPLGSRVGFAPNFSQLGDTVVSSKSLDNRCGMAVILRCLRQLQHRDMNVAIAFCVQEELGCRGASAAARKIQPDYAIVTDVSFAFTRDADARHCGKMREGVMIGISPVLDAQMSDALHTLAKEKTIPHQSEVMAETTGTNADIISCSGCGVRTALLSVPICYMHTPIETVDVSDIAAAGDLMTAWIEQKGAHING